MIRKHTRAALVASGIGLAIAGVVLSPAPRPPEPSTPSKPEVPVAPERLGPIAPAPETCADELALVLPDGRPPLLSCDDARRVIKQARDTLAVAPPPFPKNRLGENTADWLDPHGLWSAAPDAPTMAMFRDLTSPLASELEAPIGVDRCLSAERLGAAVATWVAHLRGTFNRGREEGIKAPQSAGGVAGRAQFQIGESAFEDGAVTLPAETLAERLGRAAGQAQAKYGTPIVPYIESTMHRLLPELDAQRWSEATLAAAVRAYVPLLDAHGAWAPMEEETSLYDLNLLLEPPPRLWTDMARTAIGIRIDSGAAPPLKNGDVVLAVHGIPLGGMSVEQAEQFAIFSDSGPRTAQVVFVRDNDEGLQTSLVAAPEFRGPSSAPEPPLHNLPHERVPYGSQSALVVSILDVPDSLGADLSRLIQEAQAEAPLGGVLLDLRDNGGGSTDGAMSAIGLFIPGAAMFPMRRRDGALEIDRTPTLAPDAPWNGPVAALVDGNSASAAEMIAGAFQSYERGPLIGATTYGKGCAQEYLDDAAHAGVLRLTTLVFSLPDGSPVQKSGVEPNFWISLPTATEKEKDIPHALAPWHGPDVRTRERIRGVPWPLHVGNVGPCSDEAVCRALQVIGRAPAASR